MMAVLFWPGRAPRSLQRGGPGGGLLLALVHGSSWMVLAPDADIYEEDYAENNNDILTWRLRGRNRGLPYGVGDGEVYDFDGLPTAAEFESLKAEGAARASVARMQRGVRARPLAGDGADASSPGGLCAGLLARSGGALEMPPPAAAAGSSGGAQAKHLGRGRRHGRGQPGRRANVGHPRRRRQRALPRVPRWHTAPRAPVLRRLARQGPRTTQWVCNFITEIAATPLGHHEWWKSSRRRLATDQVVGQHETWCKVLQTMLVYDQLDVSNLASAELIARQIQLLEDHDWRVLRGQRQGRRHQRRPLRGALVPRPHECARRLLHLVKAAGMGG